MQIADLILPPRGVFELEVYRRGELIERWEDRNLIVNGAKTALASLLGGAVSGNSIATIGFGTSGTAPAVGNTALTSAYSKAVGAITYPAAGSVRFAFSLGSTEANGKAILEFGLFTGAGVLFARKTRSTAINKESDLTLAGGWTITF